MTQKKEAGSVGKYDFEKKNGGMSFDFSKEERADAAPRKGRPSTAIVVCAAAAVAVAVGVAAFALWPERGPAESALTANPQETKHIETPAKQTTITPESPTAPATAAEGCSSPTEAESAAPAAKQSGEEAHIAEEVDAPDIVRQQERDGGSDHDTAKDVIKGIYGNGADRKRQLGEKYESVQRIVNEILRDNK